MALDYKCPNCGRALGYKGLCWVCRAEEERNTVLAWTEQEMREKIAYLIENAEKLKEWGSKEYNTACRLIDYRGICPPELSRGGMEGRGIFPGEDLLSRACRCAGWINQKPHGNRGCPSCRKVNGMPCNAGR